MEYQDTISLVVGGYVNKVSFDADIDLLWRVFVDMMANLQGEYSTDISELGYCLQVLERLKGAVVTEQHV